MFSVGSVLDFGPNAGFIYSEKCEKLPAVSLKTKLIISFPQLI